ncbi:MAG: hypothetical protein ACK55Z_12600, partial [bacterium]
LRVVFLAVEGRGSVRCPHLAGAGHACYAQRHVQRHQLWYEYGRPDDHAYGRRYWVGHGVVCGHHRQ